MDRQECQIYLGNSMLRNVCGRVTCNDGEIMGESYHCIQNYDQMPPFFMSVVSSSDHWLFISSTGGLTAGRINAESALFPYTTDDKVTENYANTGHVAVLLVTQSGRTALWEPFGECTASSYRIERNLYKSVYGDKLVFEEINHDLNLRYCYAWRTSDRFGFVMTAWIESSSPETCTIEVLSGLQNVLPYGATAALQSTFSNLLNGYKRNELESETGLGIFALSSMLTDLAEPSEALKATTVWQVGLDQPTILLSTRQVKDFRRGLGIVPESDVRGYRGAYLVRATFDIECGTQRRWHIVAEVNQDHSRVASLISLLRRPASTAPDLIELLETDIAAGTAELETIVASADGLQTSADHATTTHHFSNTLYNVMRGGIFVDNYAVDRADFVDFIRVRNRRVSDDQAAFLTALPERIDYAALLAQATATGSPDLLRLCYAYLPLTFSRRHGDPSRPWNKFSINLKKPDGSRRLDYQGNWRDIFQNWEPLAWSYPEFVEGMISVFVNATTADGYNPYRVTRDGIEWEAPSPEDPWANIGYWSDHQIIYLQKLLEISARFHPGRLEALLGQPIFSHANVPYHIKPYAALVRDWYDTIVFDRNLDGKIAEAVRALGTDGKLIHRSDGTVVHVTLAEKLLILLLAKLGNFVPEGGIWMNTQRPEWNDANNALVGKGISVVTLAYLWRYITFLRGLLTAGPEPTLTLSAEVGSLLNAMRTILEAHQAALRTGFGDAERREVMDALGQASSDYRWRLYDHSLSGDSAPINRAAVLNFLALCQRYIDATLRANRRDDGLYHAYNILRLGDGTATVDRLYEMLEGQVAVLSSGMLSPEEALDLLHALRQSRMFRADQHSYPLYPDRDLPGFLSKNQITADKVTGSRLVAALVAAGDTSLIVKDADGVFHFNGTFRNTKDVKRALDALKARYGDLVAAEGATILQIFEDTFHHSVFTGRSGTFFAYEGLGSIYWHMVAKLLLAAQEAFEQAVTEGAPAETVHALASAYNDIRRGLGFNKTAEEFGAFPTDPYSHTPAGQGAKQPGMTGLVKEELLTRMGELGIIVEEGRLGFEPRLLRPAEFLNVPAAFEFIDIHGKRQSFDLPVGSLAFTFCQVPVVYVAGEMPRIEVAFTNGTSLDIAGARLDEAISNAIFRRDGSIRQLTVTTPLSE